MIPQPLREYFGTLPADLSEDQMRWYAAKQKTLGDKMKREYPSTAEEAFEAGVDGSYYHKQLAAARKEGRITKVKVEPLLAVDTWWDLGMHDSMAIWLGQQVGNEHRLVGYYECHGETFEYYAEWLDEWGKKHRVRFGRHHAPHDIKVRELGSVSRDKTRHGAAAMAGIHFDVVPNISIQDGVHAVRRIFPYCWFDEEACAQGLAALEAYHKQWDDINGIFLARPVERHWSKHGADAFRMKGVTARPNLGRRGGSVRVRRSV